MLYYAAYNGLERPLYLSAQVINSARLRGILRVPNSKSSFRRSDILCHYLNLVGCPFLIFLQHPISSTPSMLLFCNLQYRNRIYPTKPECNAISQEACD